MKHDEFEIGTRFKAGGRTFLCTDVGTRVVVAIPVEAMVASSTRDTKRLDETQSREGGWLNGPPYVVQELVFDENDLPACERLLSA